MKAQVAFYKGPGDWTDKLIRWWTNSEYSHAELVVYGWWYSTSPRDLKVRKKIINPNPAHWDYITVEVDRKWLERLYHDTKGSDYDWLGVVGVGIRKLLPVHMESRSRWFCSEWVAEALRIKDSYKYSPEGLRRWLTR